MKFNISLILLLTICGICAWEDVTFSYPGNNIQNGEIRGTVTDSQTGAPLTNANILILESSFDGASSQQGTYSILNVPPGEYRLQISRNGYQTMVLENVQVKRGRLTVEHVRLMPTTIEFDETIVSAPRRAQIASRPSASVTVIKSTDIQNRNISTFDQALETTAGISIQRTTGVSVQSLSLRGSSDVAGGGVGNRVMLAIDGRPALSPDSGGALWSLVPTNFIERIEVVKGALSSLYGSTAMGGVINVITKKPALNTYFKMNVTGGFFEVPPKSIRYKDSPGFFNTVELNHSNNFDKFSYLLTLSRKESDGHRQRGAHEFYNLNSKLLFDFSNNRNLEIKLSGDIGRNDYPHAWFSNSRPLNVAPKNTDNVQRKNTFSTDVYYYAIPNPRVKYSSRFYFYRQFFRSEFNPDDPERALSNNEPFGLFIRRDSRTLGNITRLDYSVSDKNYLFAGLDLRRDLSDSVPDTILYGKHQVNIFGLYAQDEHEFSKNLILYSGLRYDFNKLEGGPTLMQLSPSAGLVLSNGGWTLRFLASRAFRPPRIAERFFQIEIAGGTGFRPNLDLRAEKITSFEIGGRVQFGNIADFDAAFYHGTYDDMIYWINLTLEEGVTADEGGFLFQVQNLNKARIQGVETSLNFYPVKWFHLKVNYTYLDSKDLSENRRFGFLAYRVRHSFNFVMSFKKEAWFLTLDGRYRSRVEEVVLYPNDKPDEFFLLNGKLIREFGQHFTFSLGVNNIFNKQYEELARYRRPGRQWIFGTSFEY